MKMFVSEIEEIPGEPFGLGLSEYGAVLSDMDDIWSSLDRRPDKFELLDLPLGEFALDDSVLGGFLDWSLETLENNKIVHHDCMWSGTCSDDYHPGNSSAVLPALAAVPAPVAPVACSSAAPGRSLLLSAARVPPRPPSPARPDTPQSLDEDEPPQFKHTIDLAAYQAQAQAQDAHLPLAARAPALLPRSPADYFEDEDLPEDDSDEGIYEEYTHPAYDVRESRTYRENTIASDHSYTLCKSSNKNMEHHNLGLPPTPSDSEEEEIDVESLGEKLAPGTRGAVVLPTNPSALDRHQLQRTVASAMGARSPQPAARHAGHAGCAGSARPRKRGRERSPPAQPSRYRKRKKLADPRRSPTDRRSFSSPNSDSEAENIEKRSLHNDMERQRRIGLKNLFDELKREVPSIREKERAPKVVVLREAAALCARLQREEREREQLVARQARLLARVGRLRRDVAARRPNA